MENNSRTDFKELVRKIDKKKILLPDFQREFVWKDEEQQCKLVASVLAKMPIGSILLLYSEPDEYCSKMIGLKKEVDTNDIEGKVEFLLDGQQRITVLTNVFSSQIHENCEKINDLISPTALKRRFFLRIPKWKNNKEKDLFGIGKLEFPILNPDTEDPEFLSGDVLPFIECLSFLKDDKTAYNPKTTLSTELDDFCLNYSGGYLIPLFLLAPAEGNNKRHIILRYENIIRKISEKLGEEIEDTYEALTSIEEKEKFLKDFLCDSELCSEIIAGNIQFKDELKDKVQIWEIAIKKYLDSCITNASLNRIVVSESQRARAIDIYENLNRGGISLNTFDLIMARVAKVSKVNFYQRLISDIQKQECYTVDVLPDQMKKIIGPKISRNEYRPSINAKAYIEDKNEINSKYIDAFLDVLSLYCYNKDLKSEEFKLENIKRDKILAISPGDIDAHCEMVCRSIDRALFFFQTRCGIRNIQEINYQLMLVLVATVFLDDQYFYDKRIHDILEAWYWASIFGGEYDKDQNVTMIQHLQLMYRTIKKDENTEWISNIKEYVFDLQNFSDEQFLLLEKASEDRYPKTILRTFVCQYLLSKTYIDMFDSDKTISVFCDEAENLEAHHIIPLGTIKKVGQTTSELRKRPDNVCNSPLNFVLITKDANKEISDETLSTYVKKITDEAKSALYINSFASDNYDDAYVKSILKTRFSSLKGDVRAHINQLL